MKFCGKDYELVEQFDDLGDGCYMYFAIDEDGIECTVELYGHPDYDCEIVDVDYEV